MSVINAIPLLLGDEGYNISRSVRLRSSASAYFNRTPASAGNRKTWTWSGWVKRGLGSTADDRMLFSGTTNGSTTTGALFFNGGGESLRYIDITSPSTFQTNVTVTPVYRDFSAWYHIVLAVDTTQATAANRIRFFVNGVEVTTFSSTVYPSQNADTFVNAAQQHRIGTYPYSATGPFDGYLTEINFIDGQALTPSSFGETDAITGVWKPKKYAGTYGTNGFYLNFSDNSSNTATTIGKDYSGNGNNWTPNNISVTAGATYDSMIDVPTLYADGGNGRGNYCVISPLNKTSNTIGNANLSTLSAGNNTAIGSFGMSSGKWYWEVTCTSNSTGLGIAKDISSELNALATTYNGNTANSYGYGWNGSIPTKINNGTQTSYGTLHGTNIVSVLYDADAGSLTFWTNGVSDGVAFTGLSGTFFPTFVDIAHANFGQRPFAYTPPTGFKALNTQNLPAPTILKGNKYFDVSLYTGNATARSITGVGFRPDFVWTKSRSGAESHRLYDAVRGATQSLYSNLTNAEATEAQSLTAFNSDGFSLGTGAPNSNAVTYAAWNWKESASAGFDIVTYTGNGSTQNVAHSLGVAPKMIFVKARSGTSNWTAYHASLGNTSAVYLNLTNAVFASSVYWNNTSPTSTQFTLGSGSDSNSNGVTYVAYCFSEVAGFSKFGSYTGNGSTDGPFIFTGFRPRYVMIKCSSAVEQWAIKDTARNPSNTNNAQLFANASSAEDVNNTYHMIDFNSNGFKIRGAAQNLVNGNGQTYIFMAFAESPFKHSLAR